MTKTIFMIHGMWGGGWHWENFRDFFQAEGFDCETPDLLYHDVSPDENPPKGLGNASLLEYAADLETKIKRLDEKPVIMGHSMGGIISLMLAGRGLAEVAVLITPSPPAGIFSLNRTVLKSFAGPIFKLSWLGRPHRLSFKAAKHGLLHRLPPDEQAYVYEKGVYESGRAAAEIGFWFLDRRRASEVRPETVKCPLLVIAGGEDRMIPPETVKKIARKYKNVAEYREYPANAHFITREKGWEQVAEDIRRWVVERLA